MGGDYGPEVALVACRQFLRQRPKAKLLLVGLAQARPPTLPERCQWVDATETIAMDDSIETALRRKRDSSMRLAIEQVKAGHADVAVSAGNTGALVAIARYLLKTLEGIDRPALVGLYPTARGGTTTMLDMGANIDCSALHLLQFAIMGSALVSVMQNLPEPSVGLLNVGEEHNKGGEVIKQASDLLRSVAPQSGFNFYGNVEGNDIFKGTVDLVVCDGFVGNVALKSSEGLAAMVIGTLKNSFKANLWGQFAAIIAYPVLQDFKSKIDHRLYNGAALLGLRGLVFKSHGSADVLAFEKALLRAYDASEHQLMQKVQAKIALISSTMAISEADPTPPTS